MRRVPCVWNPIVVNRYSVYASDTFLIYVFLLVCEQIWQEVTISCWLNFYMPQPGWNMRVCFNPWVQFLACFVYTHIYWMNVLEAWNTLQVNFVTQFQQLVLGVWFGPCVLTSFSILMSYLLTLWRVFSTCIFRYAEFFICIFFYLAFLGCV